VAVFLEKLVPQEGPLRTVLGNREGYRAAEKSEVADTNCTSAGGVYGEGNQRGKKVLQRRETVSSGGDGQKKKRSAYWLKKGSKKGKRKQEHIVLRNSQASPGGLATEDERKGGCLHPRRERSSPSMWWIGRASAGLGMEVERKERAVEGVL